MTYNSGGSDLILYHPQNALFSHPSFLLLDLGLLLLVLCIDAHSCVDAHIHLFPSLVPFLQFSVQFYSSLQGQIYVAARNKEQGRIN